MKLFKIFFVHLKFNMIFFLFYETNFVLGRSNEMKEKKKQFPKNSFESEREKKASLI